MVEQGFLLRPDRERRLFPVEAIETIDWSGVDIKRESQGAGRDTSSIQHRAIQALSAEEEWEVVLDDDGTGELADIVMLRRTDDAWPYSCKNKNAWGWRISDNPAAPNHADKRCSDGKYRAEWAGGQSGWHYSVCRVYL